MSPQVPIRDEGALGMRPSQVARELGVSINSVRRWADAGRLRAARTPGGQRRFSQTDVDKFVTSLKETRE